MVIAPMKKDANSHMDSTNSGKIITTTPSTRLKNVEALKTITSASTEIVATLYIPKELHNRQVKKNRKGKKPST